MKQSEKLALLSSTRVQWKAENGMTTGVEATDADLKLLAEVLAYPPTQESYHVQSPFLDHGLVGRATMQGGHILQSSPSGYDSTSQDTEGVIAMSRSLDVLSECPEYTNYDWDQALISDYYHMGYL